MNRSSRIIEPTRDHGSEVDVDLREVWAMIRRQWWIIVLCGAIGTSAAIYLTPRPDPIYRATAIVRVEEDSRTLASLTAGLGGNQIETEMEVIRSRSVAGAVVDSLGLEVRARFPDGMYAPGIVANHTIPDHAGTGRYRFVRMPGPAFEVRVADNDELLGTFAVGSLIELENGVLVLSPDAAGHEEFEIEVRGRNRAIDALLSGLEVVRPNRSAGIIEVAYNETDPHAARDIVNAVVDRFLVMRNETQKTEVRSTIEFLQGQLEGLSAELNAAEQELREFRERSYVINPDVEGRTQVERLAELQAERSALEAERIALEELVAEIDREAATMELGAMSPYRRLAAFPTIMQSNAFSDVLRSLSQFESERAALLTRRRPEDQDVQVLTTRISELEGQLQAFVKTYLSGLQSRVASIDATLSQFGDQLARLPANEVEFARLSRQPEILNQMYTLLQTRLKEAEVAQAVEDASVRIVDAAVLPTSATGSLRWIAQVGAFSVLGLLLGLTIGFTREYADSSVYSRSDVQTAIGVPVIGLIPQVQRRSRFAGSLRGGGRGGGGRIAIAAGSAAQPSGNGTALTVVEPNQSTPLSMQIMSDGPNPVSDAYDRLHMNILFATSGNEPKTILLTSPLPGDGKTTTAANLAVALARRGLRTLVIDADLRRGSVNSVFGAKREPGLTEVLSGQIGLRQAIQTLDMGGGAAVRFLTTGALPANPAGVLSSDAMHRLLEELSEQFDRIIVDTPPVNIVGDAALLAQVTDAVVVVARAGVTPYEALTLAAEQLGQANVHVIGAVLNGIDFDKHGSYDRSYKSYQYGKKYYAANS